MTEWTRSMTKNVFYHPRRQQNLSAQFLKVEWVIFGPIFFMWLKMDPIIVSKNLVLGNIVNSYIIQKETLCQSIKNKNINQQRAIFFFHIQL